MQSNKTPSRRPDLQKGLRTPTRRILGITSRTTTPGRSNKNSLPDNVNAALILDINIQAPLSNQEEEKYSEKDCTLVPREQYRSWTNKKIRHRFYYLKSLRFKYNKTEWKELVTWASNYYKDHPDDFKATESKSTMPSE